jgi:hypothetical protein
VRNTLKRSGKKFANAGGTLELVQGGPRLAQALAAYLQSMRPAEKSPRAFLTLCLA